MMIRRSIWIMAIGVWVAGASLAQETYDIEASVTISRPSSVCDVSTENLTYGTLERPSTGTGTATIDPAAASGEAAFSYVAEDNSELVSDGLFSWGTMSIAVTHAPSFSAELTTTPDMLERSSCDSSVEVCGIAYGPLWAGSDESTGAFTVIDPDGTDTQTGPGEGSSLTRYYRIGGTLSGITIGTPTDMYSSILTVTVTCS